MTKLKTPRLILRPWQTQDQNSLARYANNRKVWLGLREIFPHPYSESDAQWWLQRCQDDTKQHHWAMEYKNEAIGGISLECLQDVYQKTAEVGYWLGEPFWNQGLATEAVQAVTAWGFETLDILRIQASIFGKNPASCRVLEKSGYTLEGRLRKAVYKDGKILDALLYAKIK